MLRVGVQASDESALGCTLEALVRLGAVEDRVGAGPASSISVAPLAAADPRSFAFVIGIGTPHPTERASADVWLTTDRDGQWADQIAELWDERLVPFDRNLRSGVRAHRRRRPVILDPDESWAGQARRLVGRLDLALGDRALRIDHIGSTSVPGLPAKDLIDIQVVVSDLAAAARAAGAAVDAGFVPVAGDWFGPGNEGRSHREEVCVDADPGRPVNVNIRPLDSPAWRDALLFRDWLRSSAEARADYAGLKRSLAATAGPDIDGYGEAKASWVSAALKRAREWAGDSS